MTAALILEDEKLLVIHNIKGNKLRVEPPGGKLEKGESETAGVIRELREELGVEIIVSKKFGDYRTNSPEGNFEVAMYFVKIIYGRPINLEPEKHSGFEWCSANELRAYKQRGELVPNFCKALSDLENYLI